MLLRQHKTQMMAKSRRILEELVKRIIIIPLLPHPQIFGADIEDRINDEL